MGSFEDVVINRPYLRSKNGEVKVKKNKLAGDPESWFSEEILGELGLSSITFDFFIDWSRNDFVKNVWIKRVVTGGNNWREMSKSIILDKIYKCDGRASFEGAAKFCEKVGLGLSYMLFKDPKDWCKYPSTTIKVDIGNDGTISNLCQYKLPQLEDLIIRNSGGPVKMNKPLNIANTNLELYLSERANNSKGGGIWPGDADLILYDNVTYLPKALIEIKKHNLDSSIENQKLSNYYPGRDSRKYNRLAILHKFLEKSGGRIPYVVMYYSTKEEEKNIKIEIIEGDVNELQAKKSYLLSLPVTKVQKNNLVQNIIKVYE